MGNWLVDFFNSIIGALGTVLSAITSFLPGTPFQLLDNTPIKNYLGMINYFIPLNYMIATGEAWLVAIAIFYCYQIVLRWIKAED